MSLASRSNAIALASRARYYGRQWQAGDRIRFLDGRNPREGLWETPTRLRHRPLGAERWHPKACAPPRPEAILAVERPASPEDIGAWAEREHQMVRDCVEHFIRDWWATGPALDDFLCGLSVLASEWDWVHDIEVPGLPAQSTADRRLIESFDAVRCGPPPTMRPSPREVASA